jgi:hypothetical protein
MSRDAQFSAESLRPSPLCRRLEMWHGPSSTVFNSLLMSSQIHDSSSDNAETAQSPLGDLVRCDALPEELTGTNKTHILQGPLPYTRLKSDEIRIVHLHAEDQSPSIRLTTEVRKIEDAEDDYAALSYVWGDSTNTSMIYVDCHGFAATKNLVAALHRTRQFLRGEETLRLWIDAICINQGDVEEGNAQVAMMEQIYEKSAVIVFWLGETGAKGLKYLDELASWVHGRPQDHLEGIVQPKPISFKTHVRERLVEMREVAGIVTNEYWKRIWTV